jgi:hypothetical protein
MPQPTDNEFENRKPKVFRFALHGSDGSLFNFSTSWEEAKKRLRGLPEPDRAGVSIVEIN